LSQSKAVAPAKGRCARKAVAPVKGRCASLRRPCQLKASRQLRASAPVKGHCASRRHRSHRLSRQLKNIASKRPLNIIQGRCAWPLRQFKIHCSNGREVKRFDKRSLCQALALGKVAEPIKSRGAKTLQHLKEI
jgi:hypothetical protein